MASPYPTHVEVDPVGVQKIRATFQRAYVDIAKEIKGATNFGVANRQAILAQVSDILYSLDVDTNEFIKKELPGFYISGANDAVTQLQHIGAEVKVSEGFNRVHQQAIEALVSDTAKQFATAIQGVSNDTNQLLGKAVKDEIQQQIATGIIGGANLKAVKQKIVGVLDDQGIAALVDRGGKRWQMADYAEMLYRTKVVEVRNTGLGNRMLENGYDLVQVSNHNSSHQACADWEDVVLSLTGDTPDYPTLDEAEAAGLFHPNCQHAINAIAQDLADSTQAYNPDTGDYESGSLDRADQSVDNVE